MSCDSARRNDLDGRGALVRKRSEFTAFFLKTCLDQVLHGVTVQPDRLRSGS